MSLHPLPISRSSTPRPRSTLTPTPTTHPSRPLTASPSAIFPRPHPHPRPGPSSAMMTPQRSQPPPLKPEDLLQSSSPFPAMEATPRPAAPLYDPSSPFVIPTPGGLRYPPSVDGRLKSRLFGQGGDGGYLVSPMGALTGAGPVSSPVTGGGRGGYAMGVGAGYSSPVVVAGEEEGGYNWPASFPSAGEDGMGMGIPLGLPLELGVSGGLQTPRDEQGELPRREAGEGGGEKGVEYIGMEQGGMYGSPMKPTQGGGVYPMGLGIRSPAQQQVYQPQHQQYHHHQSQQSPQPLDRTPTKTRVGLTSSWLSASSMPLSAPGSAGSGSGMGMSLSPGHTRQRTTSGIPTHQTGGGLGPNVQHSRSISASVLQQSPSRSTFAYEGQGQGQAQGQGQQYQPFVPIQGTKRVRVGGGGYMEVPGSPLGPGREYRGMGMPPGGGVGRPMMGRAVSGIRGGVAQQPPQQQQGNNAQGLPFTTRPLTYEPHRTISTSSTATTDSIQTSAWGEYDSPRLGAGAGLRNVSSASSGYGGGGYVDPQGRFVEYPYPGSAGYGGAGGGHHRNVSGVSSGMMDTPQLSFSAHGSPGSTGEGGFYQQSPVESETGFQGPEGMYQRLGGLALEGAQQQGQQQQQQQQGQQQQGYFGQQGEAEGLAVQVDYSQYQPGTNYWPPHQPHQQQQGGYPQYGGPGPSTSAAAAAGPKYPRHVSSSYLPNQRSTSQSLRPPQQMPRSVSSGLPVGMQTGGLFPSSSSSGHGGGYDPGYQSNVSQTFTVSYSYGQQHTHAGMQGYSHPETIQEEGEERAAKRMKKFPPVGKRLKPGPKPKPKTPKKGKGKMEGDAAGGDDFDPFLQHQVPVQGEPHTGSQPMDEGILVSVIEEPEQYHQGSSQPPQQLPFAYSESTMFPQSSAEPMGDDTVPNTTVPKSVLETLYECFYSKEDGQNAPVKRYRCIIDDCGREFPRKSAIHSHIQTHLEDKPFMCPESDCNAAFVRQHDLRRHVRIHSGTKPFPCPCGKGFARGDALMRHRQRGICSGSIVPMRKIEKPLPVR